MFLLFLFNYLCSCSQPKQLVLGMKVQESNHIVDTTIHCHPSWLVISRNTLCAKMRQCLCRLVWCFATKGTGNQKRAEVNAREFAVTSCGQQKDMHTNISCMFEFQICHFLVESNWFWGFNLSRAAFLWELDCVIGGIAFCGRRACIAMQSLPVQLA